MAIKIIYQPIKPFTLTQSFAENNACVSTDGRNKVISCLGRAPAGFKKLYGPGGHKGIDLRAKHGQEVYCALDGVIDHIDTEPRTGLDVKIVSEVGGRRFRHIYEHLLGYQGKVGDPILAGQLVGWADNTGYSSGDHLHFEFQEWLNGQWVSIDPMPLMFNIFARDKLFHASLVKWVNEHLAKYSDNFASWLRTNKQ